MKKDETGSCRPLRVVILGHTGELGGGELALVRLCAAIDRAQVLVRVILFSDGPLRERLELEGVVVDVIPLDPRTLRVDRHSAGRLTVANLRRAVLLLPFGWALVRRLRTLRPDLVSTNTLKADLIGIPAAIAARRPLVWYVHDRIAEDYLPRSMVRLIRRCARTFPRLVLANSRATAATLAPCQAIVAYPGFTPDQAIPERVNRPLSTSQMVGLIGRISPTKGQLEFVRAAAMVLERYPSTRFRIVGAPMFDSEDYSVQVRAEAMLLGVNHAIDWIGFVDDPAVELDRLTVFVHASPVPEPFGQVIVEAMIRGVPVIATRGGGATEILEPDSQPVRLSGESTESTEQRLGLLVTPGDVDQLADSICEVLADYSAAQARATSAWRSAHTRFSIATTAALITSAWRDAAGPQWSGG